LRKLSGEVETNSQKNSVFINLSFCALLITFFFSDVPNTFKIYAAGMNVSKLMVSFEGPAKPDVVLSTQRDGTVDCTYRTKVEGEYTVNITFDDEHVIGSPCHPVVKGELVVDTSKVKVAGDGLKMGRNRQLNTVNVDPRDAKITSEFKALNSNFLK
jgi:hypothetical protein